MNDANYADFTRRQKKNLQGNISLDFEGPRLLGIVWLWLGENLYRSCLFFCEFGSGRRRTRRIGMGCAHPASFHGCITSSYSGTAGAHLSGSSERRRLIGTTTTAAILMVGRA